MLRQVDARAAQLREAVDDVDADDGQVLDDARRVAADERQQQAEGRSRSGG